MGNSKAVLAALLVLLLLSFDKVIVIKTNGQINTACTTSMITSFTPCINFITGSSANGRISPTAGCCDSVRSLMSNSVDCACLIITGNVPLSLPFNRTLAISLPQACNDGVPLRCKSSGVPLPAPGPVLFTPPPAPTLQAPAPSHEHAHSPFISPTASKASSTLGPAPPPMDDTIAEKTPASSPKAPHSLGPAAHPGIRPVLNPASSASSGLNTAYLIFQVLIAAVVFKTLL